MVGAGLAWFLTTLGAADNALFFTLGLALGNLFYAVVFHLLLAFPSGRLRGAARVPAYAVYGLVLVSPFSVPAVRRPAARRELRDAARRTCCWSTATTAWPTPSTSA